MSTDNGMKISADHLRRDAFLYVRQSSLRQVFENTESTKRHQSAISQRRVKAYWLATGKNLFNGKLKYTPRVFGRSLARRDSQGQLDLI